jgi:hypothetical protein
MNLGLPVVSVIFPRSDVALHCFQVGHSPIQALPVQGAKLDLSHVEPTAMLGRVVNFDSFCQPPGLLRFKRLVEGGKAVGVQVIQDQAQSDGVWVTLLEHALDPPRPVFSRSALGDRHVAISSQRFHFEKYLGNAVADIFMVHPCRSSRRAGYRFVHFSDELFAGFIHTDHRIVRIIRQFVDGNDVFHVGYERGALLRRDFPVLPEVRLKFVFFSMRCTVMCDTLGVRLSSTAFSANRRTVQRRRPLGASEQASAISRASKAPSKVTSRGGFSGCLRSNAAASPSSTKRFFRCSIVRGVTPRASAVSSTVQAGPCGPALHRSKARA